MSDLIRSNIECNFLDEFIKEFKTTKINNVILTHPNNEHYCSDDILLDLIENSDRFDDYHKAKDNKKLIHIDRSFTKKYNSKFIYFLQKKFPSSSILLSGNFLYPKNGYMGWHTNSDTPYLRCYITYSENGDSYFKYYDQLTKKTIVDMDNIGWTLRYFKISNKSDELLWHCVYSNTNRISIGYRIINNLKP